MVDYGCGHGTILARSVAHGDHVAWYASFATTCGVVV